MLAVRQRCSRVMQIYREARGQKGQVLVQCSHSSSLPGQDQEAQHLLLVGQGYGGRGLESGLELGWVPLRGAIKLCTSGMMALCRVEASSTREKASSTRVEASSTRVTRRQSRTGRTGRERPGPGTASYSNTLTKEYCSLS